MKIASVCNTVFKSSQLNILSVADAHGNVLTIPQLIKTIQANKEDIFSKKEEKSTKNVFAINGDYFINPSTKGILTDSQKTFGDIQFDFLKKLIYEVGRNFKNPQSVDTLYIIGNHDFGGGDKWLFKVLQKVNMTTLVTNFDLEKSPMVQKLTQTNDKFLTEKIYTIPDSKNPELKNHVLFLGITTPRIYNPVNTENVTLYDQTTKSDSQMQEKDLPQTITLLQEKINKFKNQYPDGVVVLMAHTGNIISDILAKNVEGINLILNAHDHKKYTTLSGNTQIISHGEENEFLQSISIMFDDNGKLKSIKSQKYDTEPYIEKANQDNSLQSFIQRLLRKDLKPLITINKSKVSKTDLIFSEKARYSDTILMNYITSALRKETRKLYPQLDAVGISASVIRSGLLTNQIRTTFNNVDLLNMFKGIDDNVSELSIGNITGEELISLIEKNLTKNFVNKTRSPLIQWSDIQINRTGLLNRGTKLSKSDWYKFVKIRNKDTGKYETIQADKKYSILLAKKHWKKNMNKQTAENLEPFEYTYSALFKHYLDSLMGEFNIPDEVREIRII